MANKIAILLLVFLASATDLKIADIQPAELVSLAIAMAALVCFILNGFRLRLGGMSAVLAKHYLCFSLVLIILVLVDLRQPFFVPGAATSIMKQPFWISLSRFAQLTLIYVSFIYLLECFRTKPRLLGFAVRMYLAAGLVSAVYGLVSYAVLRASGLNLGGAYDVWGLFRTKGLFVEGGPFGLYMLSVMTLKVFQGKILQKKSTAKDLLQLAVLFLAFVFSVSKAAILAMLLLIAFQQVISRLSLKVFAVTALVALVMIPILYKPIVTGMATYQSDYQNFAEVVQERPDDPNLVMGRIAASFIIPQMVWQRPLLGVGLGNYSLTRNDPAYSKEIPTVEYWDLPGLGLLGYLAELGIPLTLYLCYLLCRPLLFGLSGGKKAYIVTLLVFQLVAHLMGVQLTFIYPWIMTAIALGLIYHEAAERRPETDQGELARTPVDTL